MGAELSPTAAWSRRVRRIGGFIQMAFAAFWLVRGSLNVRGGVGVALAVGFVAIAVVGRRLWHSGHRRHRPTAHQPRSQTHRASRDRRHHHPAGRILRCTRSR